MPVFIGKYNEIRENKAKEFDEDQKDENAINPLLGTIKVPRNLRLLSERLPKSNYGGKPKKEKDDSNHKVNKSVHLTSEQLTSI